MKPLPLFALCAAYLFFSCSKTKTATPVTPSSTVTTDVQNGYTDKPSAINGYMYASYSNNQSTNPLLTCFCVFRDPAGDLMSNFNHYTDGQSFISFDNLGNIQLGQISFNNQTLSEDNNGSSSILYRLSSSNTFFDSNAAWYTAGNGSFKPLNVSVPRGFPKIGLTQFSYMASISGDFTLNFGSQISNYDSLIVSLGYAFSTNTLTKRVPASATSVNFTQAELSPYSSYVPLNIMAFNYSHKTLENKIYVFELSNKFNATIYRN